MKIKYNIPMINNFKKKVEYLKKRFNLNNNIKKEKVPIKYYALLILMLALGLTTLANNIKRYNKSNKEDYIEYNLNNNNLNETPNVVASNEKVYLTSESSIYTTEENIIDSEEAIETFSKHSDEKVIMPVKGEILKEYAMEKLVYSETLGMWKTHPGIDIAANIGTDVVAVSDGKIINVNYDDFYGNTITLAEGEYTYKYCNLDNEIILKKGDIVKQKDILGKIGVSAKGELQDKSHLHFEVLKDNIQINPLNILDLGE